MHQQQQEEVRQLGDRSGNPVICKVHDDHFELTWPDGIVLKGKAPRPWEAVCKVLDEPHHSLVTQAIASLRTRKTAS